MELRTTEQEVNDMFHLYQSLCCPNPLPTLELPSAYPLFANQNSTTTTTTTTTTMTEQEVLLSLESLQQRLENVTPRMNKFRQRLSEQDPITKKPRYGEKTAERVTQLLMVYQALHRVVGEAFGISIVEEEGDDNGKKEDNINHDINNNNNSSSSSSIVSQLRATIKVQEEAARQAAIQAQIEEEQRQAALQVEQERQRQLALQQAQQEELERQREQEEIARRAEAQRQAQRQAQEAAAQAERDWIASIAKGPQGVQAQIHILKQDTADNVVAQQTALTALLTLFTQIVQHPEEINFRRIRRDHAKFHQDIGRHKGGTEILIAAGFVPTKLDDVPCWYSKEPDLETDMDGWATWFDNLKAILQVVQQEQVVTK